MFEVVDRPSSLPPPDLLAKTPAQPPNLTASAFSENTSSISASPNSAPGLHPRLACAHYRTLLTARILSADQKILHDPESLKISMTAKRSRYADLRTMATQVGMPEPSAVEPQSDLAAELKQMKMAALAAFNDRLLNGTPIATRLPKVSPTQRLRFGYVRALEDRFGSNLSAVVAYGSAVYSDQPGDFDNFVIVHDLEKAYAQASGFKLTYRNLPVHLNLLPANKATEVLACAQIPALQPEVLELCSGQVKIPRLADSTIALQGWIRCADILAKRTNILATRSPQIIDRLTQLPFADAEKLYQALVLLPAVMSQWQREFIARPSRIPVPKTNVIRYLREQGYDLPMFEQDATNLPHLMSRALETARTIHSRNPVPQPI